MLLFRGFSWPNSILLLSIRLVTGTYFLQEVRAKYTCVSPLCELCDEDVENLDHFLLKCKVLHTPRLQHL
jgi:hypothetical protein